jgi:hypothetical protein
MNHQLGIRKDSVSFYGWCACGWATGPSAQHDYWWQVVALYRQHLRDCADGGPCGEIYGIPVEAEEGNPYNPINALGEAWAEGYSQGVADSDAAGNEPPNTIDYPDTRTPNPHRHLPDQPFSNQAEIIWQEGYNAGVNDTRAEYQIYFENMP